MSQRNTAIITGLSLLLMAVTAGYAYGYAFSELYQKEDAYATFQKVQQSPSLLLGTIIGWILILVLDLVVSWSLYKYYQSINSKRSAIMGWLRVIYSAILGLAIFQLAKISAAAESADQELVYQYFQSFEQIWLFGLTIFGLHLVFLGSLALEDISIHRLFGWLLLIGGAGYSLISPLKLIYGESLEWVLHTEAVMSVPMALAELALAVWMLVKGGKKHLGQ